MAESVTVLTLHTPGRTTLSRCAASVAAQTVEAHVVHRVLVDAGPDTGLPSRIRIARLREAALAGVESAWLAWLDDDNWWEPDHLASLLATACQRPGALAYSYRRLWRREGRPCRSRRNPWQGRGAGELLHRALLASEGIRKPGSPRMRDAVFRAPAGGYAGTIDLGEWLFPTSMAWRLGMPAPPADSLLGEDDLLLWEIVRRGIAPVPTGRFTLNYSLGGATTAREVA